MGVAAHIAGKRARQGMALAALGFLLACDRHSEAEAKALASQWFELGETLYFNSQRGCTAAVYRARTGEVKSRVPLFSSVGAVFASAAQDRAFALSVPDTSADALFLEIMNADRPTGVAVQAIGVGGKPCMNDEARAAFYAALTAAPSVMVFSRADGAFAVLDPVRRTVVLTSGDV
ncbi:hypothetical protein [Marimonas lutisalis]|uniref:hypothetical protein n=1 Tax=Marimonas lutisalis TaxID=2545756 RepID=UPI0010F7AC43|nr:hypothetical protein [Marimonas lutisalis]